MANSRAVASRVVWPTRGYASYFDVRPLLPGVGEGVESPFTSSHSGRFRFAVKLRRVGYDNLRYTVNSAAESYFERPTPREDGRYEQANLFNPYWLARQGPVSGGL